MSLDRRGFLSLGAAGAIAALGTNLGFPNDSAEALELGGHLQRHRIIYGLPASNTNRFAWTIDDGVSGGSIATYAAKALDNPDIKYTYFVNSMYTSWSKNAGALRELIARGQVQLANHTHTHPDLRTKTNHGIQRNLLDCHNFLEDKFGIDARPFWRPPYGYWDLRVLQAAADIGYTAPVMWFGTLGTDSRHVTRAKLVANARKWIADGRVVIDHANNTVAAQNFDALYSVIQSKKLSMVTLKEAFPSY
jgi:peptidoglycan/xylan/chitin deacetylase (PgdA/CDA1 family)